MIRNVIVHFGEAEGYADRVVRTIPGTVRLLHLRVAEIDNGNEKAVLANIVLQDAAQAMLTQGAVLALTDNTFCRHFSEIIFLHNLYVLG